jgi:membrane-associated phospholipid phosphatase
MQFVGACLTAYYIGLLIFYIWPTYGPYVYCQMHAAQFPTYLAAHSLQVGAMRSLQAVSQHKMRYLASGYYISFPSLHVGLPLIAMWLTRNWPKVFWILALYNCIVVASILTLEWHYAIDLVGGAAVGICALAMVSGSRLSFPAVTTDATPAK